MAVQTDPANAQIDSALGLFDKVPFGGQVRDQLKQALGSRGLDFDQDLRPLLGNPVVVGGSPGHLTGAWKTGSADALGNTLDGLKKAGEKDNATIYEGDAGAFYARDGDVLVFADSKASVESALDTRGKDDRFTEEEFNSGTGDVPRAAIVRAYFAGGALIKASGSAAAAQARRVPWIGALKTAGVAVSAADDRVALDFDLLTGHVAEEDLPLAPGPASPRVPADGTIALALRDPAHTLAFLKPAGLPALAAALQGLAGDARVVLTTDGQFDLHPSGPATPVPGARGALAGRADAEGLANEAISRVQQGPLGDLGGSLFTGPLGELAIWAGNDADDLRGHVAVGID